MLPGAHTSGTIGAADSSPLSKETFIQVLDTLSEHATWPQSTGNGRIHDRNDDVEELSIVSHDTASKPCSLGCQTTGGLTSWFVNARIVGQLPRLWCEFGAEAPGPLF